MNQLEINHISKNFISHGREVKALNNINININQGDFVALIGLNGAGKTTLLRILSGILLPDSGEVKICNTCYKDNENKIKRKIGVVMGGDHSLYGKLTAAENLEFFGSFYALKQKQINKKVIELLNLFGLTQKKDILVETFSKGMKQKLLIAKALLHEPEILILDEPCNGIDIVTNLEVKNLLKKLNREYGKTIILTTHNLYDAEDLCSRLCILKEGQIIAEGAFNEVYQSYFKNAIIKAKNNIYDFHLRQAQQSWMTTKENGVIMGQRIRGLHRVGIYVPGGTAAYPSSVLMNAIPAKIAGVKEIIMVTPPGKDGNPNPDIMAAAAVAGVDRVFLVGGAQAVAALAFGTEKIPKVDKIVGPGNIFVATAKKLLYGVVDIDMIAGPSEILIVADKSAKASFLAADLMSQAEHDVRASAILLTTSAELARATAREIDRQIKYLERQEIIEKSLNDYGEIIVCENLDQAIDFANELAPEHLEMCVEEPLKYIGRLDNAGSVFLGNFSPEPLGDYFAGPNHVLPTSGTARFFSPLSVDSFVKKSSFIYYTEDELKKAHDDIVKLADTEGLTAHANSIKVRFE